ncbi:MAG TPA: hypothetical protein VEP47_02860 [Reyranella sp.]|nr:hypothetical protein [Reyranella sp.]
MRRIHPFVVGHVIGAAITGVVAGAFLDWQAVVSFSAVLALNAVIGSLVCWWRPGFEAAGWKLWLMASFANPLMVAAIAFSLDHDVGPLTAATCLPSPLVGLAARWWRKRRPA